MTRLLGLPPYGAKARQLEWFVVVPFSEAINVTRSVRLKAMVVLFSLALTLNTHAALYKCEVPDTKLKSFEEMPRIGCQTLEGKVILADEELLAELLVKLEEDARNLTEATRKLKEFRQEALVQLANWFPKNCSRASGTLRCVIVPGMPIEMVLIVYPHLEYESESHTLSGRVVRYRNGRCLITASNGIITGIHC